MFGGLDGTWPNARSAASATVPAAAPRSTSRRVRSLAGDMSQPRVDSMTDRSGNAFHDFEKAGWERAAAYYGDAFGALTAQTAQALLDAAALRAKARVLDVACGPGFITAAAAAESLADV